jgi:hypothetical protein
MSQNIGQNLSQSISQTIASNGHCQGIFEEVFLQQTKALFGAGLGSAKLPCLAHAC